jgi:hypothetical protein
MKQTKKIINKEILNAGEKIKSFEIMFVVDKLVKQYPLGCKGISKKVNNTFYLLKNGKGQERVLNTKKTKLDQCETYYGWNSFKYSKWSDFIDEKEYLNK